MTNGCNITYSNGLSGLEHWNNVEKISLPLKYSHAAGDTYTVHVTAHQLTATPTQAFALVISGPVTVTEAAVTGLDPANTGCTPVYAVLTEPPVASCTLVAGYPDCCLASASWASYIGDGFCDAAMDSNFEQLNTAACGWDGGDCCPWTCKAGPAYCGYTGYKCKNPAYAACSLANAAPSRNLAWVGDGFCDSHLNNKDCGFDMGDCCQTDQLMCVFMSHACCIALHKQNCCAPILTASSVISQPRSCGSGGYNCRDVNCDQKCGATEKCSATRLEISVTAVVMRLAAVAAVVLSYLYM
eukprot:17006-Heterococcus_DN1.PRE.5